MSTLVRDCEVDGRRLDVRFDRTSILAVGALDRAGSDTEVVDARGAALLPGLHDQHLHVLALAADRASVDCGAGLDVLAERRGGTGWVRGVRARESVDRRVLDRLLPDRPARVQHRSGGLWMLNSRALDELGPTLLSAGGADVERGPDGEPTGRLWRFDARLRAALPPAEDLDLAALADQLRGYGLTRLTDATPDLDRWSLERLRGFAIPTRLLGDPRGTEPWKLLLRDHDLPTYDELRHEVASRRPRPVAVHCVTRESLLLTLAVLDDVGREPGDRIEHGAVVPEPARLRGLRVVTQPAFVVERGEDYRASVHPDDLGHLYRYGSLLAAGVDVVASSDAPYGPVDPWAVLRAAATRDLGPAERVAPRTALRGYTAGRRVAVGEPADLVLLHADLATALDALDPSVVRRAWPAGPTGAAGPAYG